MRPLADEIADLWKAADGGLLPPERATALQEDLVERDRETWREALLLPGYHDLTESLLTELSRYLSVDVAEVQRRCARAVEALSRRWNEDVDPSDRQSVERFYDEADYLYDLMWWHSLESDDTPLAYVTALRIAENHDCGNYLDFGAGVGSGGLLLAQHGVAVTLADISSGLLTFARWRFDERRVPCETIDLNNTSLPPHTFEIITAMDVFEHLVDPEDAVSRLSAALKPGGLLFGRFWGEEYDAAYPQHIVHDFDRVFAHMETLGLVEIWKDEWLWGHQLFQKVATPR